MKLKMTILILGCLLVTILVGCGDINVNSPSHPTPTPTPAPYSVSGYVCTRNGVNGELPTGISGVTVSFSNGAGSVTTSANGSWSQTGLLGTVTITPSKLGFTFDPSSQNVTGAATDIFFRMIGFTDNFSNSSTNWSTLNGTDTSYAYQNGAYQITIKTTDGMSAWAYAPFPIGAGDDYTVQVTCQVSSGTQGAYGLVFDCDDEGNNFYYFGIDPFTGGYFLAKREADLWLTSPIIGLTYSPAINADSGAVNTLKVVKVGDAAGLFINGISVDSFTSDLVVRRVALITDSDDFFTTSYDNFDFSINGGAGVSSLSLKSLQPKTMTLKGVGECIRK
jgi:hypothetical protein